MYSSVVLIEIQIHSIRITDKWNGWFKVISAPQGKLWSNSRSIVHTKSDEVKENGFTKLSKLT